MYPDGSHCIIEPNNSTTVLCNQTKSLTQSGDYPTGLMFTVKEEDIEFW